MALTKCTAQTDIITNIGTTVDERGLTPGEFKAKFDEGVTSVKDYINNTLTVELDQQRVSSRNLLHNWDFRNPVNQRGQSSYSTTLVGGINAIDRWKILATSGAAISLTINNNSVTLATEAQVGSMIQNLENPLPEDMAVTLSIKVISGSGGIRIRDADWVTYAEKKFNTQGIHFITATIPAGKTLRVQIYPENANSSITFDRIKLELGTVSTLVNDPPADYGEQLALCQRFALPTSAYMRIRAGAITSNSIDFLWPCPTQLRATPTLPPSLAVYNTSGVVQSGFTFSVLSITAGILVIRATKTSHGLTDAILYTNQSAIEIISADL